MPLSKSQCLFANNPTRFEGKENPSISGIPYGRGSGRNPLQGDLFEGMPTMSLDAFHQFSTLPGIVSLTITLSMTFGCKPPTPAATELPVPKVTTTEVVSQETTNFDEYTGRTEASEIVEIRARVFGYLKTIDFKEGDFVQEGQPLFSIEPDEYEAIHKQSLSKIGVQTAHLDLAKAKLARDEKLVKSGAVSQEEYEESVASVKASEAAIEAAKADADRTALDLKYTIVKSPINGRVDRANVSKGNLLTGGMTSGTLLTTVVQEQPMHIYFDVDEKALLHYMRLRSGDGEKTPGSLREANILCFAKLADEPDFPHEGQLDFASNQVNSSTGTARLRGEFQNKDRKLVSGLFVRIRIPVGKPYPALLVPERALGTSQNIKFVYVVGDDGTAKRRIVELGEAREDLRIIKSGLKAGEKVIVKGIQRVKPGQKVEAEAEAAENPAAKEPAVDETKPSTDAGSSNP